MRITLDGEGFELTAASTRAALRGHRPEPIQQYWVEIDGVHWPVKQVISLATGVRDRNRFQSQASRRWLERLGFTLGSTGETRQPRPAAPHKVPSTPPDPRHVPSSAVSDVVLVGCVKTKLTHGALAQDLYVSDYFTKMRAYAEATGRPWFILSAQHALVRPDEWLEPYEMYLPQTSRAYRNAWGERVASQLEEILGTLAGLVFDVHAGAAYVDSLRAPLDRRGAIIVDQLSGLSFGRRLAWYASSPRTAPTSSTTVLHKLRDERSALSLDTILATAGVGLRVPGLYSWWVDESGAADLARGLGHSVEPGLIYAGQAGATRSGGSTSSNTLWGRIATMHVGSNRQFSTLRLSLASILAKAYGLGSVDERDLTRWMHAHLRVIAVPVPDATTLDELESSVLAELDPPLNLAKMPRTPLRVQLSQLRRS